MKLCNKCHCSPFSGFRDTTVKWLKTSFRGHDQEIDFTFQNHIFASKLLQDRFCVKLYCSPFIGYGEISIKHNNKHVLEESNSRKQHIFLILSYYTISAQKEPLCEVLSSNVLSFPKNSDERKLSALIDLVNKTSYKILKNKSCVCSLHRQRICTNVKHLLPKFPL